MSASAKSGPGDGPANAGNEPDRPTGPAGYHAAGDEIDEEYQPSPFPHPPWTVGLVLVAGVITLLFGVLVNPVWLLVGSPFVLVLVLWLYVRLFVPPDA